MAKRYDKGYDAEFRSYVKELAQAAGLPSKSTLNYLDSREVAVEYLGIDESGEDQYRFQSQNKYFDPKSPAVLGKDDEGQDTFDYKTDFTSVTPDTARPAPLTVIPTTSSNVSRPYTVAAGWERYPRQSVAYENSLGTLTCLFRDGTLYNYYDVPHSVWVKFSGAISKGQFLNKNSPSPELTLNYRHGPADLSGVSPQTRNMIYSTARAAQYRFTSKRSYSYTNVTTGERRTAEAGKVVTKSSRLRAGKNQATANKPKR